MFLLPEYVRKQIVNKFYKQNWVLLHAIKYSRTSSPNSRKHWSEQNSSWIPVKQIFFASITCGKTKSEKLLQTELRRDKWIKYSWKSKPKSRKLWSEQNRWWLPMKLSVFASWVCGKKNYEQLLQTELRLDTCSQVFTNILPKIQKTLIGAK